MPNLAFAKRMYFITYMPTLLPHHIYHTYFVPILYGDLFGGDAMRVFYVFMWRTGLDFIFWLFWSYVEWFILELPFRFSFLLPSFDFSVPLIFLDNFFSRYIDYIYFK